MTNTSKVRSIETIDAPLGKPPEVAEHLGVPETTLSQWRWLGTGPRYAKIGRHIRYRWADVDAWVEASAITPARGAA